MSVKATELPRTKRELLEEMGQLRGRLCEAERTLDAPRRGDVNATGGLAPSVTDADADADAERAYRVLVDTMNEAALTVGLDETILSCNQRFCDLVKTPMGSAMGQKLSTFIAPAQHPSLRKLLGDVQTGPVHERFALRAADGVAVPVQAAVSLLVADGLTSICLVATDLTEWEAQADSLRLLSKQEQALSESRSKLAAANLLLNDSRRAALNMMEDAIAARREVEETNARLQAEMEERKRAENGLEMAHSELELKVRERTQELTRANMELTQQVAERQKAEDALRAAYSEIEVLKERLQAENVYLQQEISQEYNFGDIIGSCDAISYVFFRIEQVAPQDTTVLLLGETGTGKGVVARAIHRRSHRKDRGLVTVNCTALPANLFESELFGREKGAFTGADARQMGRFEMADGGTIFLDEIGEMPLALQSKLLRVIQDGEFERLGSPRTIKVDVRIIAASNRNLEEEISKGRFREDLFYRLNVFPITIPPLRQRKEDIPALVEHFVAKFNKKLGKKIETVPRATLNALQEYDWPGNVRELESVVERALVTSPGTMLQVLDRLDVSRRTGQPTGQDVKALAELERDHILKVVQQTGWRIEGQRGAAVLLDLNPSTLRARMRKYGIVRQ